MPRKQNITPELYQKVLPKRIRDTMDDKGLTNIELARLVGVSAQAISYYRAGDRTPDAETLGRLAHVLGVSSDYLLGLTDVPSVNDKARAAAEYIGLSAKSVEALYDYRFLFHNDKSHPQIIQMLNVLLEDLEDRLKEHEDEIAYYIGGEWMAEPIQAIHDSALGVLCKIFYPPDDEINQFQHGAYIGFHPIPHKDVLEMVKMIRINELIAALNKLAERGDNGKRNDAEKE